MNDKDKFPLTSYIKGGFIAAVIRVCCKYIHPKVIFIIYLVAFRADV